MEIYSGKYFTDYTAEIYNNIESKINSESDNYVLGANIDDWALHLEQQFKIDTPILHIDKMFVEAEEREIPGSLFPKYDFMLLEPSKTFKKEVVNYHIPYSGNITILRLVPNPRKHIVVNIDLDEYKGCILINVINFYNDPERIKSAFQSKLSDITSNYEHLKNNCDSFNGGLKYSIIDEIGKRRSQILNKNKLLESLGVPIRKKDDVADTFNIPAPKLKEKIVVKPVVVDSKYEPEPTLDDENYRKILKIINDIGQNFERLPSTYNGKSEEDIRDQIIFILDPHFENGSASGETFNKSGKTDILLRYDSSVVFVAECKFWSGPKGLFKALDQLLGYLTWRNSKVAIINFVRNSSFSEVLETIDNRISNHPNYLKTLPASDESWFNYKFHLNGDRNRELDLAIISFHLP